MTKKGGFAFRDSGSRRKMVGEKVREEGRGHVVQGFSGCEKEFGFYSVCCEKPLKSVNRNGHDLNIFKTSTGFHLEREWIRGSSSRGKISN